MNKYIGFDINDKKTVACVVQKGGKTSYEQRTGKPLLSESLTNPVQRQSGAGLHILSIHRFSIFFLLNLNLPVYNGVSEQIEF
jgi:hypothetical protein